MQIFKKQNQAVDRTNIETRRDREREKDREQEGNLVIRTICVV